MKRIATTLIIAGLAAFASPSRAVVCDINVDRAYKLFVVNLDGQPFKGKRYLTYDDAAMLRDFLVMSGECVMPAKVSDCRPEGAGDVEVRLASASGAAPDRAPARKRNGAQPRGFDACTYQ